MDPVEQELLNNILATDRSYVHDHSKIGKLVDVVPSSVDVSGLDVLRKDEFIYKTKLSVAIGSIPYGTKLTQFQEYFCDFAAHIVWRINVAYIFGKKPFSQEEIYRDKLKTECFIQHMHNTFLDCLNLDIIEELYSPHAEFPLFIGDLDMLLVVIERIYKKKKLLKEKQKKTPAKKLRNQQAEKPDEEFIQKLLEDIVGPASSSTSGKGKTRRRKNKGSVKSQSTSKKNTKKKKTQKKHSVSASVNDNYILNEKEEIPLCAICMEVTADITLYPCLHTEFCYKCIKEWNEVDPNGRKVNSVKQSSCPFCRTPIEVAYPILKKMLPSEGGIEFKYNKI